METGLLLIDIQNDYFDNGKMPLVGSDLASENAQKVIRKFRDEYKTIVHVQHIAENPQAPFFVPGTEGAEIHKNVKPFIGEKIIVKNSPNSFLGTELHDYLQENNIVNLVICGMMTHMCVDATTRAAKDLGYDLVLVGDACASRNMEVNGFTVKAEDVHHSFLAALESYYAKVVFTHQFLEEFEVLVN